MNRIVKNWVATSEIRSIINRYIENLKNMGVPVERVFLFGSHARLEAGEESDVDLAVVSPLFERITKNRGLPSGKPSVLLAVGLKLY